VATQTQKTRTGLNIKEPELQNINPYPLGSWLEWDKRTYTVLGSRSRSFPRRNAGMGWYNTLCILWRHWAKGDEIYRFRNAGDSRPNILICPKCMEFKGLEPCIKRILPMGGW